ncbi:MAG: TonB-dependent receptor plug domain-containing protein [Chryseobacterium sp.]|jgi:TonB-dependent SusC/RagA subfamily outer membrane receptor|uniref:TonB-dependent receptor plug domain-containing protein n=1 Tax=Chryseobacterium sp. TaxID=1871047 RepID=UPI00282396B7|nr:TonB-dependent receptor plug domain-containing protein [Chryseobacterium sp.]MDR2235233.1 TonB-dependent receptor plug domain-containing protein [Chryseobacterium sp.]
MENNHDIDKRFNDASKLSEEPAGFPGFEKVWTSVEEKLDKKEDKKRLLPVWFPYGMAASLILGLGVLYFLNKEELVPPSQQPVITKNRKEVPAPAVPFDTSVQEIDRLVKDNIQKEAKEIKANALAYEPIAVPAPVMPPVSCHLPEPPPKIYEDYTGPHKRDTVRETRIEEVVMTGYGAKRKVASVASSSTLIASSDMSVSSALSGKVAGISVSPGVSKGTEIRIRGASSIGGTKSPLYVVDGKVIEGKEGLFNALDSENIKEVKVLKGFEASSLYGSKASEGVVIITTKKGLSKAELEKINKLEPEKEKPEPEKELPKAGQLTAGEVNDFSKWDYWKDIALPTLDEYKNSWKFFPDKRVSVQLVNKNRKPVIGEKVRLLNDKKEVIWEAVSDNLGNAELWINPMTKGGTPSGKYDLTDGSGQTISTNIREFKNGQNLIILDKPCLTKRSLDIAFVVDATGSMGDEISYLQSELLDVLKKVEGNLKNTDVRYGSVFYRDQGDEYVTRKFDFSENAEDLIGFIKKQKASGGGDTPEAVVEALQVSVDELKWSSGNSTKIMFLILDAPPHRSDVNISLLYEKIKAAAKKGITIIPLAASDTDKQTEYLMRTFALMTNGTYTFLTNDSGIGNDHIKPTIDSYEVEKLNALLLRLILQRATLPECQDGISNENLNKKLETEANSQEDTKVTVFPNPTKGIINIRSKRTIDELFVYDLAGKIIMRKENLEEGKKMIDITAYPQSIYLIRMRFNDHWETFKVIKN